MMIDQGVKVVALWAAANMLFMLILAFNTFRHRASNRIPVGIGHNNPGLERAVRAHGNNTEYVPGMLLAMLLLALLGEAQGLLHAYGATLLIARLLHAHGIQQLTVPVPPTRVLGNVVCWLLFLGLLGRLTMLAL